MKRIGINAHLLSGEAGYRRAGIHQYVLQTLQHLPWEEGGPQHILYTRYSEALDTKRPDLVLVDSRWPTERRLTRIGWEQLAAPWLAQRHNLDLYHGTAFVTPWWCPCPTVVTVYDLSFIHFPESFPALQKAYLTSQTKRSCRAARRVITISESGRQDVHQIFGVPLAQIDVVRPGVSPIFRPINTEQVESFRRRRQLPDRFVLHVGTLQPRKNIPLLLDAFAKIDQDDLELVLIGGKGWLFEEIFSRIESLGIKNRVRFAGYVPDEELPLWYNAAEVFAFPSIYEGFGMPVVEAMACGTPVLAANTSSIPEAAGQAALLFEPDDAVELANRMAAVLNNADMSDKMIEQGFQQAKQFSWERAGKELALVYGRALT